MARQLGQLASALRESPQGLAASVAPAWDDLTEQPAEAFDVQCSDRAPCEAASDPEHVLSGQQSLRVPIRAGTGVCITYPKGRNANWDLSRLDRLSLAFFVDDPNAGLWPNALKVTIGRGSRSIQYQLRPEALASLPRQWPRFTIPLSGDDRWTRTDVNGLESAHVDWLEVQMSAQGPGFAVCLDDLGFGPDPRRPPLPPFDPNRRAAHYVLALKGDLTIWVQGRDVPVKTISDLPKEPFSVRTVTLRGNLVTDDSLRNLQGLPDCHTLDLRGAPITDRGLEHLAGLRVLTHFNSEGPQWSGVGFRSLQRCTRLLILGITDSKVTDEGLEQIAKLKSVAQLALPRSAITDRGVPFLADMAELEQLELQGTRITGSSLKSLANLRKLSHLDLWNSRLNDEGMAQVASLNRLSLLRIDETDVTDKGLRHLASLTRLDNLRMGQGNREVTAEALAPLKNLTNLTRLVLYGTQVASDGLMHLRESRIRDLWLARLQTVDEAAIDALARFPELKGLGFEGSALTDASLKPFVRLQNLEFLCFAGRATTITDAGLEYLAKLKNLRGLELTGTMVTARGVARLQAALPKCNIRVTPEVQQALDAIGKKP